MKILLLSSYPEKIRPVLEMFDDTVIVTSEPITVAFLKDKDIEQGISYGYRHILRRDVLAVCPFINLHISYLPWNRGADPNLWSWLEDTPKGVTIHDIDEGVDTGALIARRITPMAPDETLRTSYDRLQGDMISLFAQTWPAVRTGTAPRTVQEGGGSSHRLSDKKKFESLLTAGHDTPVAVLTGKGLPK